MQARAAPLNAQAAPRQLEQPATPTHARAAPGKTLQELSSSVKIKDLRCEKYIRARDMCKTNVMHRQEDCMCKHVCTQPTRRSERMSLKEKQGMERKEKKEKKEKRPTKGKGEERKNEDPDNTVRSTSSAWCSAIAHRRLPRVTPKNPRTKDMHS
jgi:hypothetical protein